MKWQNRDRKLTKRRKNKKQDKYFKERRHRDSDEKILFAKLQKRIRKAEEEELYEDY